MARITNSPAELRAQIARAGTSPKVVLEATYGWYRAADTLAAAGAEVHLAQSDMETGALARHVLSRLACCA